MHTREEEAAEHLQIIQWQNDIDYDAVHRERCRDRCNRIAMWFIMIILFLYYIKLTMRN